MEEAHALIARKNAIELELQEQTAILRTAGVTMDSPLVDPEGFPRSDIDVWAIRLARVKIIELRNDLSRLMDDIQKALEVVYDPSLAPTVETSSNGPTTASTTTSTEALTPMLGPFARVDGVSPGSPAAESVRSRIHRVSNPLSDSLFKESSDRRSSCEVRAPR